MNRMEEQIKFIASKAKEISDFLKENFDPYVSVVITDSGVKIMRDEASVPFNSEKLINSLISG